MAIVNGIFFYGAESAHKDKKMFSVMIIKRYIFHSFLIWTFTCINFHH